MKTLRDVVIEVGLEIKPEIHALIGDRPVIVKTVLDKHMAVVYRPLYPNRPFVASLNNILIQGSYHHA